MTKQNTSERERKVFARAGKDGKGEENPFRFSG